MKLTILLGHSSNLESVFTERDAVIVDFIPLHRRSEPWAGKFGKWMEVGTIYHTPRTQKAIKKPAATMMVVYASDNDRRIVILYYEDGVKADKSKQ